jgi:uncharacterized protein YndB with AHSA1/START domain
MTEERISGPRVLGSMRTENGVGVVRVEDTYATDIDDLWSAVTVPERLRRWVAVVEGDLRVGGSFTATFTSGWDGSGRVEVCDAPNRLVVSTWEEGDEPSTVEVTLTAEGSRTRLVIEERGLPLDHLSAYGSGWQVHIEDLAATLAGRATSTWSDRQKQLAPAYEELP